MVNKQFPINSISRLRMGTDGDGIRTLILMDNCLLRCKYCLNPTTWNGMDKPMMMSAEDVYSRICIDRPYILATNGGITFGGGEPLLYPEFINGFRRICDSDMTLYVESSLHVPWGNIEEIVDSVDRFYVDIKSMNPEVYHKYTGGDLNITKKNLSMLIQVKGADAVVVRVPIISGFVDQKKQQESKDLLMKMGVRRFDLFKYKVS